MTLDRMPPEILQKIFDYLPRNEQLKKTEINSRWNQLSLKNVYLILAYGEQLIDENLLLETNRGYCCFSIEFTKAYEELLSRLTICAKRFYLRKLTLSGIQSYAFTSFVCDYREWIRGVTELHVTMSKQVVDSESKEIELDVPKLLVFSIEYKDENGSSDLPPIKLRAPQLVELYIKCSESRVPLILENATKLKSLGITVSEMIPTVCPAGVDTLDSLKIYGAEQPFEWNSEQKKLPNMKTLELCECSFSVESQSMLSKFENLETLIIRDDKTNLINLNVICNSLPKLKQLRLFDVMWTCELHTLKFPSLQILDINNTTQYAYDPYLEIDAQHLTTLKGTSESIGELDFVSFATIKTLLVHGLYINFVQPRLFSSVMLLYLDVPCNTSEALLLTECIHQFPNLTRLTIVLHEKQTPVSLSGTLLAISFVHLRYLHLRNFDLDCDFLSGVMKSNTLSTLILQDGTLATTSKLYIESSVKYFYMKNVKIVRHNTDSTTYFPHIGLVALPEDNVYNTKQWDEEIVHDQDDYLTYFLA